MKRWSSSSTNTPTGKSPSLWTNFTWAKTSFWAEGQPDFSFTVVLAIEHYSFRTLAELVLVGHPTRLAATDALRWFAADCFFRARFAAAGGNRFSFLLPCTGGS